MSGSLLGLAFSMSPGPASCCLTRLGTGLAAATIYSTLLVKLVLLVRRKHKHPDFSFGISVDLKSS